MRNSEAKQTSRRAVKKEAGFQCCCCCTLQTSSDWLNREDGMITAGALLKIFHSPCSLASLEEKGRDSFRDKGRRGVEIMDWIIMHFGWLVLEFDYLLLLLLRNLLVLSSFFGLDAQYRFAFTLRMRTDNILKCARATNLHKFSRTKTRLRTPPLVSIGTWKRKLTCFL